MSTAVNIRETKLAVGRVAQSALHTANVAADLVAFTKLNTSLSVVELTTEDNAEEIGKGHEFATESYKVAYNVSGSFEKFTSAEFLGWVLSKLFGKVVTTGTGPTYTHTITPIDPTDDADDGLPPFTVFEALRPGDNEALNRALIGCCLEDATISVTSGAGRQNCKMTANFVGCGKVDPANTVALPATPQVENLLPGAGLTLTVNGVNYVSSGNIISLEFGWKNNIRLDSGFYPGSGFQTANDATSGQIRGRMEVGDRIPSLRCVARFKKGSLELAKLLDQSEGTGAIGFSGANSTSASITYQRTRVKSAVLDNTDGIVSVATEFLPMYHSSNKVVTATVVNTLATL